MQVAASQTISLPSALQFFLALMIGVSVLVAALAVAPRRALPRPLLGVVGSQRELLFFVAIALDAAAGFVLLRLRPRCPMSRAYLYAVMLAALVLAVPLASGAASDLPPTPTIDSAPPNPSATGSATLSFSDADPLVTFRCQIDGGAFSPCTSPATYSGLA